MPKPREDKKLRRDDQGESSILDVDKPSDPRLAGLIENWDELPEHIRQTIESLRGCAAKQKPGKGGAG